jgi:ABC-type multidrug transport system fused ATPase/permease subunit
MHNIGEKSSVSAYSGSIAYVTQKPWIQTGTVKDNIEFTSEHDPQKLWRVIKACALENEVNNMVNKENTDLGEEGMNLSGGQKARMSLARAIYQDKDIYLLDDIFSALDMPCCEYILNECILKLLKGKTIVMVTHNLNMLRKCNKVVIMENGKIAGDGSLDDLLNENTSFKEEYTQYMQNKVASSAKPIEEYKGESVIQNDTSKKEKLMSKEDRKKGGITCTTYKSLIKELIRVPLFMMIIISKIN